MKTLKVNFLVSNPDQSVRYNESSLTLVKASSFPKIQIEKEVMTLSKKEKKQFIKIAKSFILTTTAFLTFASRSMANTLPTALPVSAEMGLTEILSEILKGAIGISTFLAAILMVVAGILLMLKKRKESSDWTSDIIKGYVQILIGVPTIFLLGYVARLLLGDIEVFLNLF